MNFATAKRNDGTGDTYQYASITDAQILELRAGAVVIIQGPRYRYSVWLDGLEFIVESPLGRFSGDEGNLRLYRLV